MEKYFNNFNETKYISCLEPAKYFKMFKFWKTKKKLNFRLQLNLKQKVMWKDRNEIKRILFITQPVLPRLLWMQGRFFIA